MNDTPDESETVTRPEQISTAINGLHDVALELLGQDVSKERKELLAGVAVAHIINCFGFALLSLSDIADAQKTIANLVTLDYLKNNEGVNPSDKIERKPLGGRRKPFTAPE